MNNCKTLKKRKVEEENDKAGVKLTNEEKKRNDHPEILEESF